MSDVTIYGVAPSTYARTARMAFHEKGVAHEFEEVDFTSGDHKKLHPFGKVPAMRHGDLVLYETLAIGTYADTAFDGPALQPASARDRAVMQQWFSAFVDYVYHPMITDIVVERLAKPRCGETPDEEKIKGRVPEVENYLSIIEAGLEGRDFFAGDSLSLADLVYAPAVAYLPMVPEGAGFLEGKPNLNRWFERVSARESFAKTNPFPPEQEAAE